MDTSQQYVILSHLKSFEQVWIKPTKLEPFWMQAFLPKKMGSADGKLLFQDMATPALQVTLIDVFPVRMASGLFMNLWIFPRLLANLSFMQFFVDNIMGKQNHHLVLHLGFAKLRNTNSTQNSGLSSSFWPIILGSPIFVCNQKHSGHKTSPNDTL